MAVFVVVLKQAGLGVLTTLKRNELPLAAGLGSLASVASIYNEKSIQECKGIGSPAFGKRRI